MTLKDIRVGVTLGDPSGVGAEICAKAIKTLGKNYRITIIGDAGVWNKAAWLPVREAGLPAGKQSHASHVKGIEFVDLGNVDLKNFSFGKVRAEYGRASMEYLDQAVKLLKKGAIDCIVTCPISKEAVNRAGFHYSGHTEYFASKSGSKNVVMMLVNKELKFCLVTRHIPLKDIPFKLNKEKIALTVTAAQQALKELFGIKYPRLVVCGINPHGSDNGLIGNEESRIILPALKELRKKYRNIDGPLGADVAIAKAFARHYDCVIAMYHDQALIPLKLLGDESGVNISLGLGFVRTSPLHGTAFDIAGKNIASPASLIAAIKLAAQCTLNQKKA
jgi:4-phospho-D-threonate 3-dehydrogenase / 4-phospho-D-erythronate 3-dehydrogenase